ncbi:MAG: sulfotransferase [Kangiellaceae bacterium]|nr:sulfotransferase [Kangiellaceae bacterium]
MKPAEQLLQAAKQLDARMSSDVISSVLRQPTIILSAPRSGSTLLFEQLIKRPGYWSIGGESHIAFASMPHLRFENTNSDSACLNESHADQNTRKLLRAEFLYLARDHSGTSFLNAMDPDKPAPINFVEKTPRNALNIPFINKVFPDAKYIYLHRNPQQNISSIMEAWKIGLTSGRFSTYPNLRGWDRSTWCFLLPRGWRRLTGKSLAEIAAFQWTESNKEILDGLSNIPKNHWMMVDYSDFVAHPNDVLEKIAHFTVVEPLNDSAQPAELPLSRTTLTPPDPNKWKMNQAQIDKIMPSLKDVIKLIASTSQSQHSG